MNEKAYHRESDYTKPWRKRAPRRVETPEVKKRVCDSGAVIDDAFIQRLTRLYKQGMGVKTIAVELGCGYSTVNRLRRDLGIPQRVPKGVKNKPAMKTLHIFMSAELHKAVEAAYFGRYRSKSMYVRALIKRDLGL